jgi:hypothetical protein
MMQCTGTRAHITTYNTYRTAVEAPFEQFRHHKESESSGLYAFSMSPAARVGGCDTAGHTRRAF